MPELLRTLGAAVVWLLAFALVTAFVDSSRRQHTFQLSSLIGGYAAFFLFQVLVVKVLHFASLLQSEALLFIYAAGLIGGGVVFARQGRRPNFGLHTFSAGLGKDNDAGVAHLALICTAAIVAGLALFSLVVPVHVWDVQAYHMPMVAGYVQNESLTLGATQDLRQQFRVNGAELQMLNLALLSGSDAWMELPNLLALVVSLAAAFELGRLVLGSDLKAWLVVILMLTAPQILFGSITAKNDIVFLALILGTFYWIIRVVAEPHDRLFSRLTVAALLCSLAIATKVMGLNVLGTAGLVLLVFVGLKRFPLRAVFVFTGVALVGILVLVGDVYWSNLSRTQVPVGIMPGEVTFTTGIPNLVEAARLYLYDIPIRRILAPQVFEHDFSHYGYLFPLLLLVGGWAMIGQVKRSGEGPTALRVLSLLTVILFVSVILVRKPIMWDQRFMIWMVPVFAMLAVSILPNWSRSTYLAIASFCAALAVINLVQIYSNASGGILARSAVHLVTTGEVPRLTDVAHDRYLYKIEGFDVLAAEASAKDSILYVGAEDTWMYPAWGRGFSRHVEGVRDSSDVAHKTASGAYAFIVVEADAADVLEQAAFAAGVHGGYAELYASPNRRILMRAPASESAYRD